MNELIEIWKKRLAASSAFRFPASVKRQNGSNEYVSEISRETEKKIFEVTKGKATLIMGFCVTAQMLMMKMMALGDSCRVMTGMGNNMVPCIVEYNQIGSLKELLNLVMKDLKFISECGKNFSTIKKFCTKDFDGLSKELQSTVTILVKGVSGNEISELHNQKLIVSITDNKINWKFDMSEYSGEEIEFLATLYEKTLALMAGDITNDLQKIEKSLKQAVCEILFGENNADEFDLSQDMIEKLMEWADKYPDRVALVAREEKLTYKEVVGYVRKIAQALLNEGIKRGDVVGVRCYNSAFTLLTIWGVYYLGAVYLPIDITTPAEKEKKMLEEAGAVCLVSEQPLKCDVVKNVVINIETVNQQFRGDLEYERNDEMYAYLMYTSGSTGNPKGVYIKRKDLLKMCICYANLIKFNENSRCMFLNNYNFDGSVKTIYTVFYSGATMVCGPGLLSDITETLEIIHKERVTHIATVPLIFQELVRDIDEYRIEKTNSIECFISGGEKFKTNEIEKWLDARGGGCRLWNIYGPAECTCFSTAAEIDGHKPGEPVPIGKPVMGKRVYVIKNGKICPCGVEGELYIAGWGIADGYFNTGGFPLEEDYLDGSEKMYKTGDIGYYGADGKIFFVGRNDRQVKIGGQRIEIGEIETIACRHHAVKNAVVASMGTEPPGLLYEKKEGTFLEPEELRAYLKEYLYAGVIPNKIINVAHIPVNSNGKMDYKKAAEILEKQEAGPKVIKGNRGKTINKLISIWENVLGKKIDSVQASFFELGGYSLLLYKVVNEINREFQVEISLVDVMENSSIMEMEKYLTELEQKGNHSGY